MNKQFRVVDLTGKVNLNGNFVFGIYDKSADKLLEIFESDTPLAFRAAAFHCRAYNRGYYLEMGG